MNLSHNHTSELGADPSRVKPRSDCSPSQHHSCNLWEHLKPRGQVSHLQIPNTREPEIKPFNLGGWNTSKEPSTPFSFVFFARYLFSFWERALQNLSDVCFILVYSDNSRPQPLCLTILLAENVPSPFSMPTMLISPSSPCIFYKIHNPSSSHILFLPQSDFSWLEISSAQVDSPSI